MKETILEYVGKILDIFVNKDKEMGKKIEEIKSFMEKNIVSILKNLQKNNTKTDKILEDIKEELKGNSSKSNEILEYLKEDVKEAKKRADKAKEKLREEEQENKTLKKNLSDLKLEKEREENKSAELNIKVLSQEEKIKEVEKHLTNEKENSQKIEVKYKAFEEAFMSEKIIKLLEATLENKALEAYKNENSINDKSPKSILNLLLNLSTEQTFVKSYYDSLVEYKKSNQEEMTKEEVAFYEAINSYFDKEVINNPREIKVADSFDKSKHRGIEMENKGEIDNGIILIPSDITNNDKIKVKMK